MEPDEFSWCESRLSLEEFFAGQSTGWGLFYDRFGTLRRQFTADVTGTWDGRTLTLDEHLAYDDGQSELRTWRIEKTGARSYQAQANGVRDTVRGEVAGHMLNWAYTFALPIGGRTWNVRFDDTFFQIGDDMMVNRTEVTKFGLLVGQGMTVFRKSAQQSPSVRPVPAIAVAS